MVHPSSSEYPQIHVMIPASGSTMYVFGTGHCRFFGVVPLELVVVVVVVVLLVSEVTLLDLLLEGSGTDAADVNAAAAATDAADWLSLVDIFDGECESETVVVGALEDDDID